MKARLPTLTLLALFAFVPACGDDAAGAGKTADGTTSEKGGEPAGDMADDHGVAHPLGTLTAGETKIEITQYGDLEPGGDVAIDAAFPAGKPLPMAVRAWIGLETAVGSRKAKLDKELDTKMHAHVDVPDPLPKDSRFWLEIERDDASGGGTAVGSVPLHQ